MRQRLNQVVMKKGSDPTELFETLSSIEDRYGGVGNLEETDLIAIVLDVATEEYHAILTSEQRSDCDRSQCRDRRVSCNSDIRTKSQWQYPDIV
jgi:hypothetical protein